MGTNGLIGLAPAAPVGKAVANHDGCILPLGMDNIPARPTEQFYSLQFTL
jgi:hypothetical protein